LRERGLDRVLADLRRPLLGVCLGMQLLFDHSDEGDVAGLGLLEGSVKRLPAAPSWPHMGWNTLDPVGARSHPLLDGIDATKWFYFVHGYAAAPGNDAVAATTHGHAFTSVVARGNVHGVQFHPEKSGAAGRRVLANFFALA
jgi:glutamine amidotransferase